MRFIDGGLRVEYGRGWVVSVNGARLRRLPSASGALVSPDGRLSAAVRVSGRGKNAKQSIWITDKRTGKSHLVYSLSEYSKVIDSDSPGPIWLQRWSGDGRWLFFAIDPGGSGSIAADGLWLRAVSVSGGETRRVAFMLTDTNYLSWCGGQLVVTAGGDRVATDQKSLLVADPPGWQTRRLAGSVDESWGALACAPDQESLVAQEQPSSKNPDFWATHWALWSVSLKGTVRRLTSPPKNYADESPRFSPDGRWLLFVRSKKGVGKLYALKGGKLVGPLLSLGYQLGYYGHQDWWQRAAWSNRTQA